MSRFSTWLLGISPKLYAAAGGAGGGSVVSQFALWVLGTQVFHAAADASHVHAAVQAVPSPVAGFVGVALAVVGAAVGAYVAPSVSSSHADLAASVAPDPDEQAVTDAPEDAEQRVADDVTAADLDAQVNAAEGK